MSRLVEPEYTERHASKFIATFKVCAGADDSREQRASSKESALLIFSRLSRWNSSKHARAPGLSVKGPLSLASSENFSANCSSSAPHGFGYRIVRPCPSAT